MVCKPGFTKPEPIYDEINVAGIHFCMYFWTAIPKIFIMTAHRRIPFIFFLALVLLFVTGCSQKEETPPDNPPSIPVLTSAQVSNITQTTATCGGTITSDGGAPVTLRGICLSRTTGFEKFDIITADGTGTGTFSCEVSELTPDSSYFIRAFATNNQGTAYGDPRSFKTLKVVADSVTDIDGNVYHVVTIGTQLWLRENLRVTRYRNEDQIPNVTGGEGWKNLTTGAYCVYDNLIINSSTYGNLYNWHALIDSRGLCPAGWHIPSDAEWDTLGTFLGGVDIAGGHLKSTGTLEGGTGLWFIPNTGATNSSGFTGLPGGYRINYGNYYSLNNVGYFWSSSDTTNNNAWNYVLDANNEALTRNFNFKTNGFSIRCCKD